MEAGLDSWLRIGEHPNMSTPVTRADQDAPLVDAAREGDRAAFGELYRRYARMVHGILLASVPHAEVDDLVQDVFVLALRRLATLRESSTFGGWLVAITRNRARDYHRRAENKRELDEEAAAITVGADEYTQAVAVLAAIRTLPEAYRETLILRFVEGMTGPEIAARTGLSPGSVRVNLHRGMRQLREKLEIAKETKQEDGEEQQ